MKPRIANFFLFWIFHAVHGLPVSLGLDGTSTSNTQDSNIVAELDLLDTDILDLEESAFSFLNDDHTIDELAAYFGCVEEIPSSNVGQTEALNEISRSATPEAHFLCHDDPMSSFRTKRLFEIPESNDGPYLQSRLSHDPSETIILDNERPSKETNEIPRRSKKGRKRQRASERVELRQQSTEYFYTYVYELTLQKKAPRLSLTR